MDQILSTLRSFSEDQIKQLLDAKHTPDSKAGIIIVPLEVPELKNEQRQIYKFFAARVLPKSMNPQHFVNPHYHKHGEEPYLFIYGDKGEMNTGYVKDNEVIWNIPKIVVPGEIYSVKENEVHSFRNIGENPYDFAFACPSLHLVDYDLQAHPEGDRYFTKDLTNGMPQGY